MSGQHRFETLGCEMTDGVATITLDRPECLNAFDVTLTRAHAGLGAQ